MLCVLSIVMCVLSLKTYFPYVLFEKKKNACPLCLFSPSQRDDEDGDDMDSYQVFLLLSILWHGAQLLLMASIAKPRAGRRKGGS